jgi:uncharacterized iron-regulated protein
MRALVLSSLLVLLGVTALAEESEVIPGSRLTSGDIHLLRVDYMRELWVGLPAANVSADSLLSAMREACDDTTAVAVIETSLPDQLAASASERLAVQSVSARASLRRLTSELELDSRVTRLVLVGVLDSCELAIRLASVADSGIEGLMLIDPPVGEFSLPARGLPRVGVDILLHPRSDQEWESEKQWNLSQLHEWGRSARLIRGSGFFDSLAQRISELRRHTREYRILKDGQATELKGADLASALAEYDVVIVGELHGNPGAHRLQLEMLRRFAQDSRPLALSTEQFERDVQPLLDRYLSGEVDEAEFLANSRPWPNYADYRPMIELCRAHGIPVIAGNIPRRLANRVFRESPSVIEDFSEEEREWTARELRADAGAYRDKFMRTMGGMDGHSDRLENMYASQAIKDDTMAESIADWLKANPGARVIHINGNFHSAEGLGVPEKLADLMPELRIAVVTCVTTETDLEPVADEWIVKIPGSRPRRE